MAVDKTYRSPRLLVPDNTPPDRALDCDANLVLWITVLYIAVDRIYIRLWVKRYRIDIQEVGYLGQIVLFKLNVFEFELQLAMS